MKTPERGVKSKLSNFIKKRLQHRYFPVKYAKFLRIPTLKNINEQLLPQVEQIGQLPFTAKTLREYWFSLMRILPYKDKIPGNTT